ncbi:MAG: CvpA family protein [Lachnospiraceae bacterium]|jgi:uncharacterized membrane protein required for colicin V production
MSIPIIVTIIALAVPVFFTIRGFYKGFLKILFTTFAVLLAIILSALLTKPLTEYLQEKTFVGTKISEVTSSYVDEKLDDATVSIEKKQNEFIDSLALPKFMKGGIRDNNTLAKYKDMGVNSFKEYISCQLTTLTIKLIAFFLLMIVVFIFLRVIFHLLKIINRIPVIRGLNRLLGGVLGLVEGLIILWLACLIIMAFSGTQFGATCMEVISKSPVLAFIYDNNLLILATKTIFAAL